MPKSRASIFGESGELDVSGFAPKKATDATAPAPQRVRAVAEAADFRSRDPKMGGEGDRQPRRYRTGRNVQLNLKASQQTVDAFYDVCDKTGWVSGEALEYAIAALQRDEAFMRTVAERQRKLDLK